MLRALDDTRRVNPKLWSCLSFFVLRELAHHGEHFPEDAERVLRWRATCSWAVGCRGRRSWTSRAGSRRRRARADCSTRRGKDLAGVARQTRREARAYSPSHGGGLGQTLGVCPEPRAARAEAPTGARAAASSRRRCDRVGEALPRVRRRVAPRTRRRPG
jgi:hypothetical protein